MSDYRLEFSSVVGPNDTERLNYLLAIVSENDELEITVDNYDKDQINTIVDVLESNEFDVQTKGDNSGNATHIIAHRKE